MGYKPARAYDYIRVATNVRLDLVAGKPLTFETLLILADADAALHQMLIEAALRGATTRELRQLAFGQEVPDPNDPQERADRMVRLQKKQATELQLLAEQLGKGAKVSSEVLGQIAKGGVVQAGLIAELGGKKGGDQGGGGGQELDPRGSNSGASGEEAFYHLCVDYEPQPLLPNDNRLYTRQIRQALKGLVMPLLPEVEQALEDVDLSPEGRRLVEARLTFARSVICDAFPLSRLKRPGAERTEG